MVMSYFFVLVFLIYLCLELINEYLPFIYLQQQAFLARIEPLCDDYWGNTADQCLSARLWHGLLHRNVSPVS